MLTPSEDVPGEVRHCTGSGSSPSWS